MVSAPLSADIGSFQQHGSAFWDVQGPYRTLHQINPARLQFVERLWCCRACACWMWAAAAVF